MPAIVQGAVVKAIEGKAMEDVLRGSLKRDRTEGHVG